MNPLPVPASVEPLRYRLIVMRNGASRILTASDHSVPIFPEVSVYPNRRFAEQVTEALRERWQLSAYCLFILQFPQSLELSRKCLHVVMQCVSRDDAAPAGFDWKSATTILNTAATSSEDAAALRVALEEIESFRKGGSAPFAVPGWLEDLFDWVANQTGLQPTSTFTQLNASPTFSLIRIKTDRVGVWFKATGEPNRMELPIAVALSSLIPRFVPRVLAVRREWNGWLCEEAPGEHVASHTSISAWERAAEALAQMQIDTIDRGSDLLKASCKDLRLSTILPQIDPFIARAAELMDAQTVAQPAALTRSELLQLGQALKRSCWQLLDRGLPETLGHIDLNPWNILVSQDRCTFLDWAAGCVSNPFISLNYLQEHFSHNPQSDCGGLTRIAAAYARPWLGQLSAHQVETAQIHSPLIAVLVYGLAGHHWKSCDIVRNAPMAGYYRSLARRMQRETTRIAEFKSRSRVRISMLQTLRLAAAGTGSQS